MHSSGLKTITSAKFKYVDEANTSKSSWIRGAKYYSCNSQLGYLIISINGKKYIHKDVPIKVWRDFKKANSFGSFYNNKLKKGPVTTRNAIKILELHDYPKEIIAEARGVVKTL